MTAREFIVANMTINEYGKVELPFIETLAEYFLCDVDSAEETLGCVLDQMIEDDTLFFDGADYYDRETVEAIEDALEDPDWEYDERQSYEMSCC